MPVDFRIMQIQVEHLAKYYQVHQKEPGLLGSTEWAEEHAEEVKKKAILMLNVDSAVSGPDLGLGGVPSLRDLVLGAAGAISCRERLGGLLREYSRTPSFVAA